jgi:c-di-GMP-binding flagellar brake protein YcgR
VKERRREPRTGEENRVALTIIPGEGQEPRGPYYCLTKDISVGGMRIMTDAPLGVGAAVQVEITLARSRRRVRALARVRWVKELFGKDVFETGLEFFGLDAESEVALIEHIYGRRWTKP